MEQRWHTNAAFEARVADAQAYAQGATLVHCDVFDLLSLPSDVEHLVITAANNKLNATTMVMAAMRRMHHLRTLVLHPWCVVGELVVRSLPVTLEYVDLAFDPGAGIGSKFQNWPPDAFDHLNCIRYLKLCKGVMSQAHQARLLENKNGICSVTFI